jgi:hypothetical protein
MGVLQEAQPQTVPPVTVLPAAAVRQLAEPQVVGIAALWDLACLLTVAAALLWLLGAWAGVLPAPPPMVHLSPLPLLLRVLPQQSSLLQLLPLLPQRRDLLLLLLPLLVS